MKYIAVVFALLLIGCASNDPASNFSMQPAKKGPPGGGGSDTGSLACGSCADVTPEHSVILVHGRNDSPARWDALVSNWTARGYTEGVNLFRIDMAAYCGDNGFCSTLSSADGSGASYVNESYANCLKRYIDEKVPSGKVDIVTHSQGGVVARYYARFLDPSRVASLVIMSGPNNGIQNCTLAGACGGVNPEDCPDSAFMRKLNGVAPEGDGSNDETPAGPTYAAVVSDKDNVISPWCTAYFALNPDQQQGDDWSCRRSSVPAEDPEAGSCKISSAHLTIPSDASAIEYAYCQINGG